MKATARDVSEQWEALFVETTVGVLFRMKAELTDAAILIDLPLGQVLDYEQAEIKREAAEGLTRDQLGPFVTRVIEMASKGTEQRASEPPAPRQAQRAPAGQGRGRVRVAACNGRYTVKLPGSFVGPRVGRTFDSADDAWRCAEEIARSYGTTVANGRRAA